MLDKLFGGDRNEDETLRRERETRIRERMQASGITEEEATRLVLSEEELAIGRTEVEAGAIDLSKRVETRHVRESVPLRHEEVEVERRPITDGYAAAGSRIGTDEEIRIPLHAEEAVVEKRVVPTEEIVVRKREVIEEQTVEADLRRERVDVHEEGNIRRVDGSDPNDRRSDML